MSSIAVNKTIVRDNRKEESRSLRSRIGRYIAGTAEVMAPGVLAMNNSYYRPAR